MTPSTSHPSCTYCHDGTESGLHSYSERWGKWDHRSRLAVDSRPDFPPPISMLSLSGNLTSRNRLTLKRQYTSDGRLVLIGERVKHHQYLRAERSGGRLRLQLIIPADDSHMHISNDDGVREIGKLDDHDKDNNGADCGNNGDQKDPETETINLQTKDRIIKEKAGRVVKRLVSSLSESSLLENPRNDGRSSVDGNGDKCTLNYTFTCVMKRSSSCVFALSAMRAIL